MNPAVPPVRGAAGAGEGGRRDGERFALASRRVVTPDGEAPGAVIVDGERIAAVVALQDVPAGVPVEDLGDWVIFPGLVDAHVHINEPGRTEWEGFATATQAAAAGGVTTLVDMPLNSSPVTTTLAALQAKQAAAVGQLSVDVGFYAGLVPGRFDQLEPLLDAGVCGVKAFLCGSGLDEFPAATEQELRAALPLLAERGVPLLAHAEIVPPGAATQPIRNAADWLAARPVQFERAAIALLDRLQQEFAAPVHVVHLAASELLPAFEAAKRQGRTLTVETCPHYLFFAAEEMSDADPRFKCAPPIRTAADRDRLWAGVLGGVIDTIGSDHSPCPPAMKHLKTADWQQAWGGVMGLELTLPVVWTAGEPRGLTLTRLAELVAQRPAELTGLAHRKGRLAPGYDADLCIWDPAEQWTVDAAQLHHRHRLSPYDGHALRGRVRRTYVRGNVALDGGQFSESPTGQTLTRSP